MLLQLARRRVQAPRAPSTLKPILSPSPSLISACPRTPDPPLLASENPLSLSQFALRIKAHHPRIFYRSSSSPPHFEGTERKEISKHVSRCQPPSLRARLSRLETAVWVLIGLETALD